MLISLSVDQDTFVVWNKIMNIPQRRFTVLVTWLWMYLDESVLPIPDYTICRTRVFDKGMLTNCMRCKHLSFKMYKIYVYNISSR